MVASLAVISRHPLFAAAVAEAMRACPRMHLLGCWRSPAEAGAGLGEEPEAVLFLVARPPEPAGEERSAAYRLWPHARLAALSVEANLAWALPSGGESADADGREAVAALTVPRSFCELGSLLLGEACPGRKGDACPLASRTSPRAETPGAGRGAPPARPTEAPSG